MAQIRDLQPTLHLDPHHPILLQASMVWADHPLSVADYHGLDEAVLLDLLPKRAS